jgi:glycosyltransferase involved in cell wall biosynthesis
MTLSLKSERALILTPGLTGADGISVMTRAVTRAIRYEWNDPHREIVVWALAGTETEWQSLARPEITYRSAGGKKVRFAMWGMQAVGHYGSETIVVVTHIHLLAVALPLLLCGARIVVFLNGIEVWRPLTALETWILRRAWRVIAISSYTATRFTAMNPTFAAHEIHVCHLGIGEPDKATNDQSGRENFALIVARMAAEERYKGHDLLLELWPRIQAKIPAATLVIAGDGNDRSRLTAKAEGLGLKEAVTFLGRVSDETLAELYRRCAVFVMPSSHEGFGLVFLEAMRAGTACIGGVGAAAEVIEHGVTGLIVDPRQPDHVREALLLLLRDSACRQRMGAAGVARFARYFTAKQFRQRLLALLELEGGRG